MATQIMQPWHDKLAALLARAETVAQAGDTAAAVAVAQELQDFIVNHPPANPAEPAAAGWAELEKIALGAHDTLLFGGIGNRAAVLSANTAELAALAGKFGLQTTANRQAARMIRFEKVQEVIVATTKAVTAIKALKAQVEAQTGGEGQVAALGEQLGQALAALEEFKTAVEPSA